MSSRTFLPYLFLVFVLVFQGCSFVDHDQVAEDALATRKAITMALALEDEQLTPAFVRAVLQRQEDDWTVVAAQFGGIAEIPSDVQARIKARKGGAQ